MSEFLIIPTSVQELKDGNIMLHMKNRIQKRVHRRLLSTVFGNGNEFKIIGVGLRYWLLKPLKKYGGEKVFYGRGLEV